MRHIAVNGLFVTRGHGGGIENYFCNVLRELAALDDTVRYEVYLGTPAAIGAVPDAPNVRAALRPLPGGPARSAAKLAYEQLFLPLRTRRADALFCPAFLAPVVARAPSVVTIHDMRHIDLPTEESQLSHRLFVRLVRRAARTAAQIVTDSAYARQRIAAVYGVPPERITVAHLAADAAYAAPVSLAERLRVRAAYGVRAPYILSVATLRAYKGLDTLIAAFAALRRSSASPVQLVLVGLRWSATSAVEAQIRAAGLESEIVVTGWVPGADLPALYQGAAAFCFPSRYEGFGIPVVEAMASGVPVVTTTATALPEVAGDAALLVEPGDVAGMAAALGRAMADERLRGELIGRGRERAARFTWRRTAEATLDALRRAAAPHPRGGH